MRTDQPVGLGFALASSVDDLAQALQDISTIAEMTSEVN
jgi:hypothetical protein